jgi:ABC-type dipeptide/oligopeptide/nickel transport system permease component
MAADIQQIAKFSCAAGQDRYWVPSLASVMVGDIPSAAAPPATIPLGNAVTRVLRIPVRIGPSLLLSLATIAVQLLVVSVITFVVLRLLPTDPLAMMLPTDATIEDAARMRHAFGFDRPITVQFWIWLRHAMAGDLGTSIQSRVAVSKLILTALPTTIELVVCGIGLGVAAGLILGLATFHWRGTAIERIGETAASLLQSIPEFLWGILLILVFGLGLDFLPFIGAIDGSMIIPSRTGFLFIDTILAGRWDAFGDHLLHLLLPAIALATMKAALIMRLLRSSLIDTYTENYIDAVRLRGISESRILFRHALRNAALPTVTLIGVQAAHTFGGTLLIEAIYGLPGLGNLMIGAIRTQDLPLIQGIVLTYCAMVLFLNALVDLTYRWLNPRLRFA